MRRRPVSSRSLRSTLLRKAFACWLLLLVPTASLRVICLNAAALTEPDAADEPKPCDETCPMPTHEGHAMAAPSASTERCLLVADPECAFLMAEAPAVVPVQPVLDVPTVVMDFAPPSESPYDPPCLPRFTPPPED